MILMTKHIVSLLKISSLFRVHIFLHMNYLLMNPYCSRRYVLLTHDVDRPIGLFLGGIYPVIRF